MTRLFLPSFLVAVIAACTSSSSSPKGGAIGDPCTADKDCQGGMFCDTKDPGGQCLKKCTADVECGTGNLCAQDEQELKCYRACKTEGDCPRSGYGCNGKDERNPATTFCDKPPEGDGGGSDAPSGG